MNNFSCFICFNISTFETQLQLTTFINQFKNNELIFFAKQ